MHLLLVIVSLYTSFDGFMQKSYLRWFVCKGFWRSFLFAENEEPKLNTNSLQQGLCYAVTKLGTPVQIHYNRSYVIKVKKLGTQHKFTILQSEL